MRVDADTWAEIRRAYETTAEPVLRLAARFNVGRTTLMRRAAKERWTSRPYARTEQRNDATPQPAPSGEAPVDAVPTEPEPAQPVRLEPDPPDVRVARMLRLLDLQLDRMERRMASGDPTTAEEEARQTRAFGTMVGSLEKVTETTADINKDKARSDGASLSNDDGERMRREIAERLERLNAQWLAREKPGGDDAV